MSNMRPLQIALLWHSFRSDNLGVGALTLSNIAILRSAARRAGCSIKMTIVGYGGRANYRDFGADVEECLVTGMNSWAPGGTVWRALTKADLVLDIAAGDSWADIYGLKRFFWQWISKELPQLYRVKLVFAPQTIGPFDRPLTKAAAAWTMRRAEHVFARDAESFEQLRALDVSRADETIDVAFHLPFEQQPKSNGRIRFGFNISGLLYGGGYHGNDSFGSSESYRAMVDGIIQKLIARGDTDVVLVPHVVPNDGSVDDDVAVSHRVAARYPGVLVAPLFHSPIEAKSFISGLDILAGSRMHATIAAVSSGVAVVPLAYSRKFRGVFNSIGYGLVGDCTSTPAADLIELTLAAVDQRRELTRLALRGQEIARQKLGVYEDYLADLLSRLAVMPERNNFALRREV